MDCGPWKLKCNLKSSNWKEKSSSKVFSMLFWALRAAFVGNSGIHHRSALSNGVWSRLHIGPLCGLRWTITVIHVHCNSLRKRTFAGEKSHLRISTCWTHAASPEPWPVRKRRSLWTRSGPWNRGQGQASRIHDGWMFSPSCRGKFVEQSGKTEPANKAAIFLGFKMLVFRGVYLIKPFNFGGPREKNMIFLALSWIREKKSLVKFQIFSLIQKWTQSWDMFFLRKIWESQQTYGFWIAQTNEKKSSLGRIFSPTRWFKPRPTLPIVGGHLTF